MSPAVLCRMLYVATWSGPGEVHVQPSQSGSKAVEPAEMTFLSLDDLRRSDL